MPTDVPLFHLRERKCATRSHGKMTLRRRMIVALQREIHVFSFPTPTRRLLTLETRDNPKGLVEIATLASAQKQLLAFPGHKLGSVQLLDLGATEAGSSSAPVTLAAHQVLIS